MSLGYNSIGLDRHYYPKKQMNEQQQNSPNRPNYLRKFVTGVVLFHSFSMKSLRCSMQLPMSHSTALKSNLQGRA